MEYNPAMQKLISRTRAVTALILIILLILPNLYAFAEATGKLNVFTDLKGANIYIDGKLAGEESVVGWVLPVGTHYVKVEYQGKTVYAKTVEVYEDRTNTITSDNFVDIRTSTPSRGAVETEAARLREYRGDAGFGYFGASPNAGLSVKWWCFRNYGIQVIGFANSSATIMDNSLSARLLIGFPQKIFSQEVLDAYMAIAIGKAWHTEKLAPPNDTRDEVTGIYFGVEAKLAELANALFLNRTYIIDDAEDTAAFVGQLLTLGLFNICYTSFELGIESRTIHSNTGDDTLSNFVMNFGLHYFF